MKSPAFLKRIPWSNSLFSSGPIVPNLQTFNPLLRTVLMNYAQHRLADSPTDSLLSYPMLEALTFVPPLYSPCTHSKIRLRKHHLSFNAEFAGPLYLLDRFVTQLLSLLVDGFV